MLIIFYIQDGWILVLITNVARFSFLRLLIYRTLDKSAFQKINFLISHPKLMLWVLKRTVSMRRFF